MRRFYYLKYIHVLRNIVQRFQTSDIAIIGSYHGGNVGDMALGLTMQKMLSTYNISSDLQTLHNLEKWPKRKYAIIGGGAIGYNEALLKVYKRYKNQFDKVAFIGVDFNEDNYSLESLELLKKAQFISCRSLAQQERLSHILNRKDIIYFPDIVFALDMPKQIALKKKEQKFLINAIPLYGYFKNRLLMPERQFQKENPFIYENFETIHKHYRQYILRLAFDAHEKGWAVETLPFSTEDELYSELYFKKYTFIKRNNYSSNPYKILSILQSGDEVLATRYHATILSLRNNKTIYPVAYAQKNKELLDIIASSSSQKRLIADDFIEEVKMNINYEYKFDLITEMETQTKLGIEKVFNALNIL